MAHVHTCLYMCVGNTKHICVCVLCVLVICDIDDMNIYCDISACDML